MRFRAIPTPEPGDAAKLRRLGLAPGADAAAIRAAYLRLARQLHPDLSDGETGARFADVAAAYRGLSDAAADGPAGIAAAQPSRCLYCGGGAELGRASWESVTSFVIGSRSRVTEAVCCARCAGRRALKATAHSGLLGWWSPVGPFLALRAARRNARPHRPGAPLDLKLLLHHPVAVAKAATPTAIPAKPLAGAALLHALALLGPPALLFAAAAWAWP